MLIENLERKYIVIKKNSGQEGIEQFVCSLEEDRTGKEYGIARVSLDRLGQGGFTADVIGFLTEQRKNKSFQDFFEYFTDAHFLYIVTIYGNEVSLEEKLDSENCSLPERLEIGKCLLEHMILLGAPHFFYWSALAPGGIRISKAMEIQFQYDLTEILHFQDYGIGETAKRLAEQLQGLYKKELELQAFPEMEQLIAGLNREEYKDYIEIYEQYIRIYESWCNHQEIGLTPRKFTFRLWEKIKRLGGISKKLVAVLILLAAAGYTFLSIQEFMTPPSVVKNYAKIGSLELKE